MQEPKKNMMVKLNLNNNVYQMKWIATKGIINEAITMFSGKIMLIAIAKGTVVMMQRVECKTLDELKILAKQYEAKGFRVYATREIAE